MTIVLRTDAVNPDKEVIDKAAEILLNRGLVAFPTETVYGLGAVAYYEDAVLKVFKAKMRPPDNPLIIHVSSLDMLNEVATGIPDDAYRLIEKFWPGPLTLILPRHPSIPRVVTGGLDTVAVRMPGHPVALKLIDATGRPVAAPSANISGRPSPTTGEHVIRDLMGRVDAIIDAGETFFGVESTVVNILEDPPVLLRPGAYPVEEVEKALGKKIVIPEFARGLAYSEIALAPGMKYRHYSPEAKLILVEAEGSYEYIAGRVIEAARSLGGVGELCVISSSETMHYYRSLSNVKAVFTLGSRVNLYEVARNLFKVLRLVDEAGCRVVFSESFPETGIGLAVMNRLRKASSMIIRASSPP
ncbi:L-threonylcarbamoyladenylate synthase [Desulfurococcus mucosus]|uniref:Threonylcarbamoyl-AMP synthase n=1 Tax=Desulfurococcus mucosus (strain ATCC 35584 / DSM 2162 / JCM 9187 / O7/1) TaxID=765177 RepID=E8R7T0_DESM0|nr:translation factor SUA5 [Desulfurococcus mucosus DSM 2162]